MKTVSIQLPASVNVMIDAPAGEFPATENKVDLKAAEAQAKVAELWFKSYERRAAGETQFRFGFWSAVLVGAFTIPVPASGPAKVIPKIALDMLVAQDDQITVRHALDIVAKASEAASLAGPYPAGESCVVAFGLWLLYVLWIFPLLWRNVKDLDHFRDLTRLAGISVGHAAPPPPEPSVLWKQVFMGWSGVTQLIGTALLLALGLAVLVFRDVVVKPSPSDRWWLGAAIVIVTGLCAGGRYWWVTSHDIQRGAGDPTTALGIACEGLKKAVEEGGRAIAIATEAHRAAKQALEAAKKKV